MANLDPRWLLAVGLMLAAPTLTACADLTRSDAFVVIKELPAPPPMPAQLLPGAAAQPAGGPAGQPPAGKSGG